ncbi:hypothetical protein GCM10023150_15560 [Kangiella taiwanensis]|uniref:Uncharacterized protein n=1 Tax=Kangiella taiwanensis TaxID=1079179 RepID=A0ABP8I2V7_9GAMM
MDMDVLQERHFPLRNNQLKIGIFSSAVILCPHLGQAERGVTKLYFSGKSSFGQLTSHFASFKISEAVERHSLLRIFGNR